MSIFEHDGKTYELKMTRAGVRAAEAAGLSTSELGEKPFSSCGLLFFAALYSQYRVTPNKAQDMLDDLIEDGTFQFDDIFGELAEAYTGLFGSGGSEKKDD